MVIYRVLVSSCLLLFYGCVRSTAIPKPDEASASHHNLDHMAHVNHLQNPSHDNKYDHDQFLGEDQAKTFDQLLPDESRRRLG